MTAVFRRTALPVMLAMAACAAAAANPIEGEWQLAHSGAVVRISAAGESEFCMTWVDGGNLDIVSGTLMGVITASDTDGLYCLCGNAERPGRKSDTYALQLNADNPRRLEITPYHKGIKIRLSSLLPYGFRHTMRQEDTTPQGMLTARRTDAPQHYLEP